MQHQTGNLVAGVSQAAFFSLGGVCVVVAAAFWLYFVAAALLPADCAVFAGGGVAGLAAGTAALAVIQCWFLIFILAGGASGVEFYRCLC